MSRSVYRIKLWKGIFKNDWVKKIEIRIEKEQRKLQQTKNRISLLNQKLKHLKKKEEIRKMYIGQK